MNPDERDKVQDSDQDQERAGNGGAEQAGPLLQIGVVVGKAGGQLPHTQSQEGDEYEDDGGVSERKPETDGHRFLAVRYQLPSGVVDSGDVIGVESMAHAERVRRDTESDAEDTAFDRVVAGDNQAEKNCPPDDVERYDGDSHPDDASTLASIQTVPSTGDSSARRGHCRGHRTSPIFQSRPAATLLKSYKCSTVQISAWRLQITHPGVKLLCSRMGNAQANTVLTSAT